MKEFVRELDEQRWDDHRFYHQSRINQSLHLFSAVCFLCSYVLLFINPAAAVLVGWLLAMVSRQAGHFFFEPKGYDRVNAVTHEYKEDIKVGFNLRRKIVLLSAWVLSPVVLVLEPSFFGLLQPHADIGGLLHNTAILWLFLAGAGLVFRTVQLFVVRDVRTGIVWFTKILTDPFHDIKLYHRAPLHLLRGELLDPINHAGQEA
ncbi:MAG: hypothetical protein PVI30_21760 [Myxococcales bacterium]